MKDDVFCKNFKSQINTLSGKIDLLERQIQKKRNEIRFFENAIRNARDEYKNIVIKYGTAQPPVFGTKKATNAVGAMWYGTRQYGAATIAKM